MDAYEKYYRRSYNAITRLMDVYKNGYDEAKMYAFKKEMLNSGLNNRVKAEEQANIMFTVSLALLGINKESIEHTGKFTEYKAAQNGLKVRDKDLPDAFKADLALFDSKRVRNTDFDDWLSILIDVPADTTNVDHLKRVRNGLLHSNFYVDGDNPYLQKIHIKTKSYYESELLSIEFQTFVFEYFSNLENLGLSENMHSFLMDTENHINSREDLIIRLSEMSIINYTYDNLKRVGVDTPELLYASSLDSRYKVDVKKFAQKMAETKNFEHFKVECSKLDSELIAHTFCFIEKMYQDDFYKFDIDRQCGIITTHLQYKINPKKDLSNWLMHFWYLFSTLYNNRFHIEYFKGDDYCNESCHSALMVLKAYLVMYRLQANVFSEIDYSKITFDKESTKTKLISDHTKLPYDGTDYFAETFLKEKAKDTSLTDEELSNKVICEVIRNSLAHGNVLTYQNGAFEDIISLTDIDPKTGSVRKIEMLLSKFEEFLNSEAFIPNNCYKKEEEFTRARTK